MPDSDITLKHIRGRFPQMDETALEYLQTLVRWQSIVREAQANGNVLVVVEVPLSLPAMSLNYSKAIADLEIFLQENHPKNKQQS